ncbi:hypothetical protein Hanom_Chr15g01375121 [Helianthus anomalus]
MGLTSWMKIARLQTFWIQMRKTNLWTKVRKSGQTSGTKMAFYSNIKYTHLQIYNICPSFKACIRI